MKNKNNCDLVLTANTKQEQKLSSAQIHTNQENTNGKNTKIHMPIKTQIQT